jgi:hypothetical protein
VPMRFVRVSIALAAIFVLLSTSAAALAGPAAQGTALRPAAAKGQVAEFFKGSGAALYNFTLQAGRYDIQIYAQYTPVNDVSGSGECSFDGYLDNLTTGSHASVGTSFPIQEQVPWNQPAVGNLAAGTYQLYIFPGTTCEWSVEIVALGPPSKVTPAIHIVFAGLYVEHGSKFTPVTVVHMDQTTDFSVFYTVSGTLPGPLTGQIVVHETKPGPTQTFRLAVATNGTKQFYIDLTFAPKYGAVVGPAEATFTITSGKLHASRTVHFAVAK